MRTVSKRGNILCICTVMSLANMLAGVVINYPWPDTARRSEYYSVRIRQDGLETEMYVHGTKPNLNRIPQGVKPEFDDSDGVTGVFVDRSFSFVQFAFTGEIEVEVTKLYGTLAERVEIAPKAYGLNPHYFDGRTVRFMLENHSDRIEYISVNFVSADNQDDSGDGTMNIMNGMMLFGDIPENDVPDPDAPGTVVYSDSVSDEDLAAADLIYFPPGDHDIRNRYPFYYPIEGQLVDLEPHGAQIRYTKDGQAVYAAGGAYIRGAVWAQGHDNLKLHGRGIFTGDDFWWHAVRREGDLRKEAFMDFLGSSDSTIEGIVIVNPTHHTIPSSDNTTIRNLKIIGFASNMDGIRPGTGSFVEEIFIRTSDDYDYARSQHVMRNCVFWPPRNGAIGQLGWNNLGAGQAHYDGLYLINGEILGDPDKRNVGLIGSVLQQGVHLSDNLIENIYAENDLGILVHMTIQHEPNDSFDPSNPGLIENFTFRNIIMESDFRLTNGTVARNPIKGFEYNGAKAMIRNVRFVNLVAGNVLITNENFATYFDIDPDTTENITFESEGTLYTVNAIAGEGGHLRPQGQLPTPEGMNRTVAVIADPGYRIKRVFVDGVDQGRLQNITFHRISSDHSVTVEFEQNGDDYFDTETVSHEASYISDIDPSSNSLTVMIQPGLTHSIWKSHDLLNWDLADLSMEGQATENPFLPFRQGEEVFQTSITGTCYFLVGVHF